VSNKTWRCFLELLLQPRSASW